MFWKKDKTGPVKLDGFVSRQLVTEIQKLPSETDHWVKYMAVKRAHPGDENTVDIRIFDQTLTDQARIKITNYETLNDHQEFIIFEGWINEKMKKADLKLNKTILTEV